MRWGILGSIGRGVQKAGRGLLEGIDNAAMNSLTSGGLLDDALAPYQVQGQQQRQIGTDEAGQPMYSPQQEKQKWAPTQQEKRSLRGSYLMSIGAALQQGKPIGEGVQQYQQNAIGQIQAGQQAQQQNRARQVQQAFQQEMQGAAGEEAQMAVLRKFAANIGPDATEKYARSIKEMRAPVNKLEFRDLGDKIQAFDPVTGAAVGTPTQKGLAPSENYVDQGGQIQRMLSGVPSGAPLPKSMTPGETASDVRGKFPSPVNIPGVGLMSIDPTIPNRATPITGPNGNPLVSQVGNGEGSNRGFQNSDALRKEFNTLVQPYTVVAQAYAKIQEAAKSPTPAGDISLIYGYMKLLDPTSVVREGEFATAQNAGSIPDRVRAAYNRAIDGTRLADDIRTDFVSQAGNIVRGIRPQLDSIRTRYSGISQNFGLDPNQVVYDPFAQVQIQPQQQGRVDRVYNPKTGRFEDK